MESRRLIKKKKNRDQVRLPKSLAEQQRIDDELHEARKKLREAKAAKQRIKERKTKKQISKDQDDDDDEFTKKDNHHHHALNGVAVAASASTPPPTIPAIPPPMHPAPQTHTTTTVIKNPEQEEELEEKKSEVAKIVVTGGEDGAVNEEALEYAQLLAKKDESELGAKQEGKLDSNDVLDMLEEIKTASKKQDGSTAESLQELRELLGIRIIPIMRRYFKILYKNSSMNDLKFRTQLKLINDWTPNDVKTKAKEFVKANSEIVTLFDYAFAANLMILANILQREKHASSVEVPVVSFIDFTKKLYFEAARKLYKNPGLMKYEFDDASGTGEVLNRVEGDLKFNKLLQESIGDAIRLCIDIKSLTKLRDEAIDLDESDTVPFDDEEEAEADNENEEDGEEEEQDNDEEDDEEDDEEEEEEEEIPKRKGLKKEIEEVDKDDDDDDDDDNDDDDDDDDDDS